MALTKREAAILDFERSWWQNEGSKESAIRDQLELSATRYYQLLNQLLDSAEAMSYDPLVVRRLQRLRTVRRRVRYEGPIASQPPAR